MKQAILFASAAMLLATPAMADIDTTSNDAGTIYDFGASDTATYGQTFTAGVGDTLLSGFSLFLRNRYGGSGTLDLRGYVATWDGSKAGTLLFESATQTMNAAGNLQEFAFAPNIAVTPGAQYVAFLSISNLSSQPGSQFGMPYAADSIAGQFVYMNNGTNFAALFSDPWTQGYVGQNDVWLKADFNAVPEPAAWALMISGFGLIGAAARRRQRTSVSFA